MSRGTTLLMRGWASTATQEGTGEYVDDTVITTKVKAAIRDEPTLKSGEHDVRLKLAGTQAFDRGRAIAQPNPRDMTCPI